MGNKQFTTPFPTYEIACQHLGAMEIAHAKKMFRHLSRGYEAISLANLHQMSTTKCVQYLRKYLLPRLFTAMDTKKDGLIDIEEYVSALALFRVGSNEEKIKVLFLMYEPSKNGTLPKDNFRQLLVDATLAVQKEDFDVAVTEVWLRDQADLADGMADMALQQFASQEGRIDLQEFISFVKVEGSVQGLLQLLPSIIECDEVT